MKIYSTWDHLPNIKSIKIQPTHIHFGKTPKNLESCSRNTQKQNFFFSQFVSNTQPKQINWLFIAAHGLPPKVEAINFKWTTSKSYSFAEKLVSTHTPSIYHQTLCAIFSGFVFSRQKFFKVDDFKVNIENWF